MVKLLRVTALHFVAGAIFEKVNLWHWVDGQGWVTLPKWRCTAAAPILRYLVGEWALEVKEKLQKKGYKWEWVSDDRKGDLQLNLKGLT
jgi:hypothetical protein